MSSGLTIFFFRGCSDKTHCQGYVNMTWQIPSTQCAGQPVELDLIRLLRLSNYGCILFLDSWAYCYDSTRNGCTFSMYFPLNQFFFGTNQGCILSAARVVHATDRQLANIAIYNDRLIISEVLQVSACLSPKTNNTYYHFSKHDQTNLQASYWT